jgi:hypothetical protein
VRGDQPQRGDLRPAQGAEAVEGGDAVEAFDPRLRRGRFGQGLGHRLDRTAGGLQRLGDGRVGEEPVGDQDFRRLQRGERRGQALAHDRHDLDLAGRKLDSGDGRLACPHRDRGQAIGAAGV